MVMKSKEVLRVLRISRGTLGAYIRDGRIKGVLQVNGFYDYDAASVYALLNKSVKRNVLYGRVSTPKQRKDLERQVEKLKTFCAAKGTAIDDIYTDIASGINYDDRKDFFKLLECVLNYEIAQVIITHKDRLTRIGFSLFENLFNRFGTEIIVMDSTFNEKTDNDEIFEEIVTMLHCFSMRYCSKRKIAKIKETLTADAIS